MSLYVFLYKIKTRLVTCQVWAEQRYLYLIVGHISNIEDT